MTLSIWLGLTALAGVVWLSRHFQLSAAARAMPPLHSGSYADPPPALPSVSFLVAAKDEAGNIEACLRSMLRQEYPDLQVIAVNDRSADGTAEIIERVSAGDARAAAVHVTELREGWFGKNNAMREGVARARGQWLAFTDADCTHDCPRALAIAMRYALERGADFLSVLPAHETRSFWERVVQPACSGIMLIWFNPIHVNDPRRPTAYANGAFMLMRRDCYDAVGGHEAVRTELNEDMHLARRAKAMGFRLAVVSNLDLYRVRMYGSFAEIWAGWSRIFYGCFGSLRRLLLSMLVVIVMSLLPWAALGGAVAANVWSRPATAGAWRPLLWVAALTCAMQLSVMWRFYRLNQLPPAYGLLYPLGAAVGLGALLNAVRRLGGRTAVNWRGTLYRGRRVDSPGREDYCGGRPSRAGVSR